jgi:hypothetical protein
MPGSRRKTTAARTAPTGTMICFWLRLKRLRSAKANRLDWSRDRVANSRSTAAAKTMAWRK